MIKIGYSATHSFDKELIIDDIGNCAIEAIDLYDQFYYFVTKTELGMVSIFQYGPIIPDIDELPDCIQASYVRKTFNKQKLIGDLSRFLGKKLPVVTGKPNNVIDAWEVTPQEVYNKCPNLVDVIKNWTYNKDKKAEDED